MEARIPTNEEIKENQKIDFYPYKYFERTNGNKTEYFCIKYKNILEILDQKGKTNKEKYEEYVRCEKIFRGLQEIKVDTADKTNFLLENLEILDFLATREDNKNISLEDFPELKKKIEKFNLEQEKYYKSVLEMIKNEYLGNYKIITEL